jgi:hypothetical protein
LSAGESSRMASIKPGLTVTACEKSLKVTTTDWSTSGIVEAATVLEANSARGKPDVPVDQIDIVRFAVVEEPLDIETFTLDSVPAIPAVKVWAME